MYDNCVELTRKTIGSKEFYNAFLSDVLKDSKKSIIEKSVNTELIFFYDDNNKYCVNEVITMLACVCAIVNKIPAGHRVEYINVVSDFVRDGVSKETLNLWALQYSEIVSNNF